MLPNACPKLPRGLTAREERQARKVAAERKWRHVCQLIDRRDGKCCRVCGRFCDPNATDRLQRAERHHLVPRSLGGEHDTKNVLVVCGYCHDERHVKGTLQLSGNADEQDGTGRTVGVRVERLTERGWVLEKLC